MILPILGLKRDERDSARTVKRSELGEELWEFLDAQSCDAKFESGMLV